MRGREPIVPHRRRRIPEQFSWVDHRLVRDGHIQGRSMPALVLYLFLVTVADADGLSWYSDAALCHHLSWTGLQLQSARAELVKADLIAYRKPLYQVLDLAPACALHTDRPVLVTSERNHIGGHTTEAMTVGQVLQNMLAGGAR